MAASRLGAEGWAIAVVLAVLGAKAALDLLLAPLWSTAWYAAPERLAAGFLVGTAAWIGVEFLCSGHKRIASPRPSWLRCSLRSP